MTNNEYQIVTVTGQPIGAGIPFKDGIVLMRLEDWGKYLDAPCVAVNGFVEIAGGKLPIHAIHIDQEWWGEVRLLANACGFECIIDVLEGRVLVGGHLGQARPSGIERRQAERRKSDRGGN